MSKPMTNPHDCPAPACTTQVAEHQLACKPHWRLLPKNVRNRITNSSSRTDRAHAVRDAYAWFEANTSEVPT